MCSEIPVNHGRAGAEEPQKVEGKKNATLSNHCCAEGVLIQTLQVYLEASGKDAK
jgi:hypothetical protein